MSAAAGFDEDGDGVNKWKLHFCNFFYQSLLRRAHTRLVGMLTEHRVGERALQGFEIMVQMLVRWKMHAHSLLLHNWKASATEEMVCCLTVC